MNWIAALFPSYRLMESALMASRREAEGLRADLERERRSLELEAAYSRELRNELKELRERHDQSLMQTANFMAYAKTARLIFIEPGSNLPQPAPPVTNDQLVMRTTMRERTAEAKKTFDEQAAAYFQSPATQGVSEAA
jgi:hypothetical protein